MNFKEREKRMGDQLLEEKLQAVLSQKECPQRLQETISQCIQITQEQQSLRGEQRTDFWQYLSDVFRFEGIGIFGLHTVILLLVCAVVRSTVNILLLPAFMPLFALAVMPVFLRSQYYGVSEIEAVTRASGAQIILAKLILSGAANLVCITVTLSMGFILQDSYKNMGQMVLYCLVPYLVCMIALLRIVRLSPMSSAPVCMAAMTGGCIFWGIFAVTNRWIYEISATGIWIVAFLVFTAFFVKEIYMIIEMRREGKPYGIIN